MQPYSPPFRSLGFAHSKSRHRVACFFCVVQHHNHATRHTFNAVDWRKLVFPPLFYLLSHILPFCGGCGDTPATTAHFWRFVFPFLVFAYKTPKNAQPRYSRPHEKPRQYVKVCPHVPAGVIFY